MASIYEFRDNDRIGALISLLEGLGSAAVAFSGGVDSAFLLKAAHDVLGEGCLAVTAESPAFPEGEESAAFCRREGIRQLRFPAGEGELREYVSNPPDRCYHCKRHIFRQIREIAAGEGISAVIEGSNVDDLGDYRPGLRALEELGVLSPLRQCGFTKAEIRRWSRALELPTWDKPSAACLASRIPYGEPITPEKLSMIAQAEAFLHELGVRQCRVRIHGAVARIETERGDFPLMLEHREAVANRLMGLGFSYVTLDLKGFRSGSMNEVLPVNREGENHGTA